MIHLDTRLGQWNCGVEGCKYTIVHFMDSPACPPGIPSLHVYSRTLGVGNEESINKIDDQIEQAGHGTAGQSQEPATITNRTALLQVAAGPGSGRRRVMYKSGSNTGTRSQAVVTQL